MVKQTDTYEDVLAVLTENADFEEGCAVPRARRVVAAMEELQRAGFSLWLLPPETSVRIRRKSWFRRWWDQQKKGAEQ